MLLVVVRHFLAVLIVYHPITKSVWKRTTSSVRTTDSPLHAQTIKTGIPASPCHILNKDDANPRIRMNPHGVKAPPYILLISCIVTCAWCNIERSPHIMKDQDIVGEALASVLPQYNKIWFRVPHLLQLNLILMIPLLSSAVAGYDGTSLSLVSRNAN